MSKRKKSNAIRNAWIGLSGFFAESLTSINKYKIIIACFGISWTSSAGIIYYSASYAKHIFPSSDIAFIFIAIVELGLTTLLYIVAATVERKESIKIDIKNPLSFVLWAIQYIKVDYILLLVLYCMSVFSATLGLSQKSRDEKIYVSEVFRSPLIDRYNNDIDTLDSEIKANLELMVKQTKPNLVENFRISNITLSNKRSGLIEKRDALEKKYDDELNKTSPQREQALKQNQDDYFNRISSLLLKIFIAGIQFLSLRLSVLGSNYYAKIKSETPATEIISESFAEKLESIISKVEKLEPIISKVEKHGEQIEEIGAYTKSIKDQMLELAGELDKSEEWGKKPLFSFNIPTEEKSQT